LAVRIGHGFDVHAFGPGDHVVLGGVRIPYQLGMVAHSDGDVILHAICDALLGAAGLGDIGHHFPNSDPGLRGVDSRALLREVATRVGARSLRVGNVDVTAIAEAPKLAPYIPQMTANIAADLDIALDQVNVKATTTERLGWLGRGEGIAAHAVTLLMPVAAVDEPISGSASRPTSPGDA
jgi:2-C-methyl-D-erythritol 2,4-cyclodiphosphate synthase